MPTEAELVAYYARDYRRDYQFAYGKTPPRTHLRRTAREAEARMAIIAPALKPGSRILDFGSGSGAFLSLAKKNGHEVLGIEPGEDFAAYARDKHGVEVIIAPWQEAQLADGQFDVITASHVIEHLREPVSACASSRAGCPTTDRSTWPCQTLSPSATRPSSISTSPTCTPSRPRR